MLDLRELPIGTNLKFTPNSEWALTYWLSYSGVKAKIVEKFLIKNHPGVDILWCYDEMPDIWKETVIKSDSSFVSLGPDQFCDFVLWDEGSNLIDDSVVFEERRIQL